MCQICSRNMSKYHMSGHMDKHCLFHRFQYKEGVGKGVCTKSYKQKSALCHHLAAKHNKSLSSAKVNILGKDEFVYESKDLHERADEDRSVTINELIDEFGEEVYV